MDTSNRNPEEKIVFSLNLIDYLTAPKDKKVVLSEISPENCSKIMRRLIEEARPYIKYLPSFEELKEVINRNKRYLRNREFHYEAPLDQKTRVIPIEGGSPRSIVFYVERLSDTFYLDKEIYLTDNGLIVMAVQDVAERIHEANTISEEQGLRFKIVNDETLTSFIKDSNFLFRYFIETFLRITEEGVKKRENQLGNIKRTYQTFKRVQSLVLSYS